MEWFQQLPGEWAVFVTAMLPLIELRGAIPLGLAWYEMSPLTVYALAVVGNLLPLVVLLSVIKSVSKATSTYSKTGAKLFEVVFRHARHKWEGKYARYGTIALILFTAIPFPLTGAWTASVASYVLGVPPLKAAWYISLGVLVAGILVTLASLGIISIL